MDQKNENNEPILRKPSDGPFQYQIISTIHLIKKSFNDRKRDKAIVIYLAFTECASEEGRKKRSHTAHFVASLEYLAAKSHCSVSTIKRYANDFREIKILDWMCRRRGKFNLSNWWKLLRPPAQHNDGIPLHHTEPRKRVQYSEPERKERKESYITNKGNLNNIKTDDDFKFLGDIMKKFGTGK